MTTSETIKDLLSRKESLRKFLNIDTLTAQIAEEEKQLAHIRSLFPNGTVGTIIVEGVKVDMSSGKAILV
jgi:hypothetical protein